MMTLLAWEVMLVKLDSRPIDIDDMRKSIDNIDDQLICLLEERMSIVSDIAKYKADNNLVVKDNNREKSIIKRLSGKIKDKSKTSDLLEIIESIFRTSRKTQSQMISRPRSHDNVSSKGKIGYQGVEGSYSEEALINYFGSEVKRTNYKTFDDVFKSLLSDEIEYAVLPIENSTTGAIKEVYDLLVEYGFYIVGETDLSINHNLIGLRDSDIKGIKEVYSHTQGFEQCSGFIKDKEGVKCIPYHNTAISVKHVAELNDKSIAAIGSKRAASIYKLDILEESINDNSSNVTRFVVLSKDMCINDRSNKTSILLSTPHESGALYKTLSYFAKENINMTKIESHPIKDKPWEYYFFIDIDGLINTPKIKKTLNLIRAESSYFKVLGSYQKQTEVY